MKLPLIIYKFVLFFVLLSCLVTYGQEENNPEIHAAIWKEIQTQMEQSSNSDAYDCIPDIVTGYYSADSDSLYPAYNFIMIKLERQFNIPAAIFVGEEMVSISRHQNKLKEAADAYTHLYRYYDALGFHNISINHVSNALEIYEDLGMPREVLESKLSLLQASRSFKSGKDILKEMKVIQREALALKDTSFNLSMHLNLIPAAIDAKDIDEALRNIEIIEDQPVSNPVKQHEYPGLIITTKARAEIALADNETEQAISYYRKALEYCRQEPSKWLEINILTTLAEIAWENGNEVQSASYLNTAEEKALELDLPELLTSIYAFREKVYENKGQYKEAFYAAKQKETYGNLFKARSKGFNIEAYYLQKEKDNLAVIAKNDQLQMKVLDLQYRRSLYTGIIIFMVALGLLAAYYFERKRKLELIEKNTLIKTHIDQLEKMDDVKSRFFANISHELRTPLSLVLGPISTLIKDDNLNQEQLDLLKLTKKNTELLKDFTNNILDLKKLESGNMKLFSEPTHLYSFFNLQLAQFESLTSQKGLNYSYEIQVDDHIQVQLDREKCRQVLYNLISNAIKYTPNPGDIDVKIKLDYNNNLSITVRDTGIGIRKEELALVFDRFFQSEQEPSFVIGGTGIGLSLCHEYAKLLNGELTAASELGKGSTFCLWFPVTLFDGDVKNLNRKGEAHEATIVKHKKKKKKLRHPKDKSKPVILLVEDNYDLKNYIELLLQKKYHVITADNGQEALQYINTKGDQVKIDLIVSDLMMPVMNGHQLINELRSNPVTADIPFIMLTARSNRKDRIKALRIGVDDYIIKPFDQDELLIRIKNLIRNRIERIKQLDSDKPSQKVEPVLFEEDKLWLEKFENYLITNMNNDSLTIPYLSDVFAMSESTLLRQLKRLTGLTPAKYLQEIRLNQARELLENKTTKSVAVVATEVGYKDAKTFSRSFKKHYGKLPTDI